MRSTAIVIFAFNRPDHLAETLAHLSRAEGVNDLPLYVFVDGARHEREQEAVLAVRALAENFSHPQKTLHFKARNSGLKASVLAGVQIVFEQCDQIIVLEDDICVHPDFLQYHLKCLNLYEAQSDIWSVSAYVIPAIGKALHTQTGQELFMAPRASSWGWSTWKSRWQQAVWDKEIVLKHATQNCMAYHKTGGDKLRMLMREMAGKSSSWAILWDYSHFMHGAYCVYPHTSYVRNIGLDHSGTHSRPSAAYAADLTELKPVVKFEPVLNVVPAVNNAFRRINLKFYRTPFDLLKCMFHKLKAVFR